MTTPQRWIVFGVVKVALLAVAVGVVFSMYGCNTVRGVGQDIEESMCRWPEVTDAMRSRERGGVEQESGAAAHASKIAAPPPGAPRCCSVVLLRAPISRSTALR